jgi:hypothetical protein
MCVLMDELTYKYTAQALRCGRSHVKTKTEQVGFRSQDNLTFYNETNVHNLLLYCCNLRWLIRSTLNNYNAAAAVVKCRTNLKSVRRL